MSPAPLRLVVNADGFGQSASRTRGILRAHQDGIVTSASITGNCQDLPGAIATLGQAPRLGVGAHITLVEGLPISPPGAVRSLVEPDGRFPSRTSEVFLRWAQGIMRADDVEREIEAQVMRLRGAGLALDHLSTRGHIGFLPTVGRAIETVARRHGIAGIRMAMEHPTLGWVTELPRGMAAAALGGLAWLTRRQMGALRHGPQTWGVVERELDEIRILEILGRMRPGPHEIICHPEDEPPARELRALTAPLVRQAIERRGIELCRWSDLF